MTVFFLGACTSAPTTVKVENPTDFDRNGEIVEVRLSDLKEELNKKPYLLKDETGKEIPYQLLKEDGHAYAFIFQANVKANASTVYSLSNGMPAEVQAKTFARHIPERKDDFAWENDLAAYRMYGPALANENPSNGVDLWLKRTDTLIVDKFYHDELVNGLSYHIDHGQGLDCYKVGHTLGAGGIAPYTSQLWVGNHYDKQEVKENGPLRSVFTLTYDSVMVDNRFYTQTITITVDAGSLMNKAVVSYQGPDSFRALAGGIFLHDGKGLDYINSDNQVIAYAEESVSDAGLPSGRNYVAVYMPEAFESGKTEDHLLLFGHYTSGNEFIYYFGGGWSKWQFPTDKVWFDAVDRFSRMKKEPLKVSIN